MTVYAIYYIGSLFMEKFITAVKFIAGESNIIALILVVLGAGLTLKGLHDVGSGLIMSGTAVFQHKTQQ